MVSLPGACGAAAQPVGLAILPQQAGQPLHFALVRRHQQHACFLLRQRLDLLQKRRNRTMKAQRRTGREGNLVHGVHVLVQHVHRAQLIHLQPGQRRNLGQQALGGER